VRAAQGSLLLAQLNGDLDSRLDDSGAVCSLLGTNVEPLVQTSFLNAYAHALTTGAHYQAGLDAANQEDRLAKDHELEFVHRYALLNRARALVGLRQFSVAGRCIANLRRELARAPDIYVGFQAALQTAALYLSMGDVVRAEAALLLDVPHRLSKSITAERLAMRALTSAAAGNLADARTDAELARGTSRLLEIQALAAVAEAIVSLEEELVEEATLAVDEVLATACLNAIVLGIRSYPGLAPVVAEVAGKDRLAAIFLRSNDTGLAHRVGIAIPRSRLRSATLSPRELEIHGLIAQGMTNREISSLLFISQSTTKVHVQHILEKLGVRSRVEAARVWQETEKPDPD
jgi:DNA-binding NarL/FixJ family response regulator